jgi:hypothetical protein
VTIGFAERQSLVTAQLVTRVSRLEASSPDHAPGMVVLEYWSDDEKDAAIADCIRTGVARENDQFICLRRFGDPVDISKRLAPYRMTSRGAREVGHGGH